MVASMGLPVVLSEFQKSAFEEHNQNAKNVKVGF